MPSLSPSEDPKILTFEAFEFYFIPENPEDLSPHAQSMRLTMTMKFALLPEETMVVALHSWLKSSWFDPKYFECFYHSLIPWLQNADQFDAVGVFLEHFEHVIHETRAQWISQHKTVFHAPILKQALSQRPPFTDVQDWIWMEKAYELINPTWEWDYLDEQTLETDVVPVPRRL